MNAKTIQHGNLTLPLPEGWVDVSQIVAMGPEEDGFRASLVVSTEPARGQETPRDVAARALPQLQRAPGFALVGEKPASFGGLQGFSREYTCQVGTTKVAQLHRARRHLQLRYVAGASGVTQGHGRSGVDLPLENRESWNPG